MADELPSPENQQDPPDAPKSWPHVPAVDGEIYGFTDPNHGDHTPMVSMTLKTWQRFDQQMRALRARLEILSAENIEMKQGRHPDSPRIILPR